MITAAAPGHASRAEALLAAEKRVLEAISTGRPLPEVLDRLVREIEGQAESDTGAGAASILLVEPRTQTLRLGAAPSLPDEVNRALEGLPVAEGHGSCGTAAYRNEVVVITDIENDPLMDPYRELARAHGIEALWSQPICARDGSVLGTFAIYFHEPRAPSSAEREIVERASNIAAIAIERDRADAALRERETHYRRLVQASPMGIYAVDAAGVCIEINAAAAEILGREPPAIIGQHFSALVAPEELDRAASIFAELLTAAPPVDVTETRLLRPSGERRLVVMHSAPILDGAAVVGFHGLMRDITEERERDQRLRRMERLASVGTLISGVAHELNNPLSAILGFADLLLLDEQSAERREDLFTIQREAERMAKIVSDLRILSRETVEATGSSRDMGVDVNDVVEHVLRTREYALTTRNVSVVQDLAPELPAVCGDSAQLEQVLLNLVVNAEQALEGWSGEKRLLVRTRASNMGVSVHVVDSGPGIPAGQLERIFDPFWTTKAPGIGTGLGLSMVHGILREHGGEVHVESEPGEGAAFRVELRRLPAGKVRQERREKATTPPRPLRILVVDDEPSNRRVLCRFLERRGHTVDAAEDGEAALRFIDGHSYDVILSDLRMPGMSGDQLLVRLRERGDGLDRRVLLLTGDTASEEIAGLLEESPVPVLAKPLDFHELADAVERVAEQAGAAE